MESPEERRADLLHYLNSLWSNLERFPEYREFNRFFGVRDTEAVKKLERKDPRIGITEGGDMTTLTLLATITDFLADDRLAVRVSETDKHLPLDQRRVIGFAWMGETGYDDA